MASAKRRRGMVVGATPGKLCLLGALGVVLIVVLYRDASPTGLAKEKALIATSSPQGAGSPRPGAPRPNRPPKSAGPGATPPEGHPSPEHSQQHDHWSEVALEVVKEHDPFAVPVAFLPPPSQSTSATTKSPTGNPPSTDDSAERMEREKQLAAAAKARQDALNALAKQGVRVVLRDGNQWIAVVGDQTIRVGDQLGAFRVIEILPDGVLVEDPNEPGR